MWYKAAALTASNTSCLQQEIKLHASIANKTRHIVEQATKTLKLALSAEKKHQMHTHFNGKKQSGCSPLLLTGSHLTDTSNKGD